MLLCACSAAGAPRGMVGGDLTELPQPLSEAGLVSPPPRSHRGTGVAWHSPKGWVGGQSRAGLWGSWPWCPCPQQERSLSSALPRWAQLLPPQASLAPGGGGRAARGGRLCPALPAPSPFPAKCFI